MKKPTFKPTDFKELPSRAIETGKDIASWLFVLVILVIIVTNLIGFIVGGMTYVKTTITQILSMANVGFLGICIGYFMRGAFKRIGNMINKNVASENRKG